MTKKIALRAPGGPGIEPRWTLGAKLAVGTAYSTSSRVWYTLDAGCSILQVSAQDRKTTRTTFRLQEKHLVLHNGVPSKVVLLKFHTPFLWPDTSRRSEANRRPLSNCRNIVAKKISSGTFIVSARFQAITRLQSVFLLASASLSNRLSRHFRPLRPLRHSPC